MLEQRVGRLLAAAMLVPALAQAQAQAQEMTGDEVPRGMHEPVRLTAGGSNQWMGALVPARDALYFVSDRNATAEVFVQQPVDAGPRLLFEHNADVSWPLPSPDGTRLAFISYRADATGDLCIYTLAGGETHCLTGLDTAELQPLWLDGGQSLGVVTRPSLHGNYELRRFAANARPGATGEVIAQRNMLGAAVSPDGQWLAYLPIERTRQRVGVSFANRSGRGVTMQRLRGHAAEPVQYVPDLPGLTGSPAFAPDGEHLYFAQYLNDTNGDGAIDGNDHSVLFRVPFDGSAASPVQAAWPEQLTSAEWNCRYPAPAPGRLIVTCAHEGSLDIYSLPLTGAVPPAWTAERVRGELHVARNHWTRLLFSARLASLMTDAGERVEVLRNVVRLHMDLREHESALYYTEQIRRLAGPAQADAVAWAEVMRELIGHRREDVRLAHGQLSDRYVATERERAVRLAALAAGHEGNHQGNVAALARLALSEVQDDLGRKREALATFAAVRLDRVRDPLVLEVFAARARAIYTLRGDRDALLAVYRDMAMDPAFGTLDRLRFAERFVKELLRGVPRARRQGLVDGWVARLEPGSELALMIQVSHWLLQLDDATEEDVRRGIFELYKDNKDPDRRRALVLATVRAASRRGNEYLQYQFATSWASWLRRDDPERKYAEALYRQVVLERAYTELSKGDIAGARASFYAATVQATSLEAHIGFIEARLREGQGEEEVVETYEKRFARKPNPAESAFVQAYLLARELPALSDPAAFEAAAGAALGHLRRAAETWPQSMEIHHVWGTVLHQRALRSGSKQDAVGAHTHYLLALDLARSNPRFRAALMQQLGLLQAALGNHRIALDHFAGRDRLPHVRPAGELGLRMAMARSYFHIGSHAEAAAQAERALALVEAHGDLARYRPLVIDRLALYLQNAGEHARAQALYRSLIDIVDSAGAATEIGAPVNRIKARVGAAAASLSAGEYDDAATRVRDLGPLLDRRDALRPAAPAAATLAGADVRFDKRDYQILLAGLEAQAYRGLGRYQAATRAMERRTRLLAGRFAQSDLDEDLLELARAYHHLAEYAYRQEDLVRARVHLEQGLRRSSELNRRTGSGVNEVGLRLLQAYAELHIYGGVDLATYTLDLRAQLTAAYDFICEHRSPRWEQDRFLFGLYLTLLELAA